MKENKYIIRRTLSQERFEVLWTKHKGGKATLKDLAEMDEIINRDAGVRRFVLEEMSSIDPPDTGNDADQFQLNQQQGFFGRVLTRIKTLLKTVFGEKSQSQFVAFPSSY